MMAQPTQGSTVPDARSKPGAFRWGLAIILSALAIWLGLLSWRAYRQRSAVAKVEELGGLVYYDYEGNPADPSRKRSGPGVVGNALGRDFTNHVVKVNLRTGAKEGLTDDDLEVLSGMPAVRELSITNANQVTDEGLAILADFDELEKLTLIKFPQLTNEGLAFLAELSDLRELELIATPKITNQGLEPVGQLKNLHAFTTSGFKIDGSIWKQLSGCPLKSVTAAECELTDDALATLAEMETLEQVSLPQNKIRGPGLAQLKGLKLTSLVLGHNPLEDSAIPHLKALTSLETLNLVGTPISKETGQELAKALPKCQISITVGTYDPEDGKWDFDDEPQDEQEEPQPESQQDQKQEQKKGQEKEQKKKS
jgi:hypothetical protein